MSILLNKMNIMNDSYSVECHFLTEVSLLLFVRTGFSSTHGKFVTDFHLYGRSTSLKFLNFLINYTLQTGRKFFTLQVDFAVSCQKDHLFLGEFSADHSTGPVLDKKIGEPFISNVCVGKTGIELEPQLPLFKLVSGENAGGKECR